MKSKQMRGLRIIYVIKFIDFESTFYRYKEKEKYIIYQIKSKERKKKERKNKIG